MGTERLPDLKTRLEIRKYFSDLSKRQDVSVSSAEFAAKLDALDQIAHLRQRFLVPSIRELLEGRKHSDDVDLDQDCIYMSGNSLGLQPKAVKAMVDNMLDKWSKKGVHGHTCGQLPWLPIEDFPQEESARIVGAKPIEVAMMNTLTVNVHLGMVPFYRPTKDRHKILVEEGAFPSDHYAIESQIRLHGYDPKEAMIVLSPREGERVWKTEEIVKTIEEQGDSIAFVWLSGVHYSTGYVFDMKTITEAAHSKGCYVGFDLAHAAGNIELHLHDWQVDTASWCTYKYLNSGPGSIGGFFVHEKHAYNFDLPRLLGWWSHKRDTRFVMDNVLELQPGAAGFQLSNPPVLPMVCLVASLAIFKETSMPELCLKSRMLSGYLEMLIEAHLGEYLTVINPQEPFERGCQLSLLFSIPLDYMVDYLKGHGAVVDIRGQIVRVSPVPLYNSFTDVLRLFLLLKNAVDKHSEA